MTQYGLWRDDTRTLDSGGVVADLLFYVLKNNRSDGVAKIVTTCIRKFIPMHI